MGGGDGVQIDAPQPRTLLQGASRMQHVTERDGDPILCWGTVNGGQLLASEVKERGLIWPAALAA